VSKWRGSRYGGGRSSNWIKVKNPGRAGGAAGSGRQLAGLMMLALRRTVWLDGERRG
jgi:hypothetical protein